MGEVYLTFFTLKNRKNTYGTYILKNIKERRWHIWWEKRKSNNNNNEAKAKWEKTNMQQKNHFLRAEKSGFKKISNNNNEIK